MTENIIYQSGDLDFDIEVPFFTCKMIYICPIYRLHHEICMSKDIATLGPNGPTQLSPSQPQLRSWGH